jgi:hypothetical protein
MSATIDPPPPPAIPPTIPPTVPPTVHPILGNLNDIQGDLWSKGFPKYNETYYLFIINNAADFARALRNMVTQRPHLISNLPSVKSNWVDIKEHKASADSGTGKLPVPNALIAFTYKGLETVSVAIHRTHLRSYLQVNFCLASTGPFQSQEPEAQLDRRQNRSGLWGRHEIR